VRSPDALPDSTRSGYWLAGGRLHFDKAQLLHAGVSFHHEREQGEFGRRSIGADLAVMPVEYLTASGQALFDTDRSAIADAHAAVEVNPFHGVAITGEYNHTDPSLFLSHQSVLSVFGTDRFDEIGGDASMSAFDRVTIGAASYIELFGGNRRGTRTNWHLSGSPDARRQLTAGFVYSRVTDIENGYYSLRGSLRYRFLLRGAATYEQYVYLYDRSINGIATSTVEAASVEWKIIDPLRVLIGGSVLRSPLAKLDAQTLVRVVYEPAGSFGEAP